MFQHEILKMTVERTGEGSLRARGIVQAPEVILFSTILTSLRNMIANGTAFLYSEKNP